MSILVLEKRVKTYDTKFEHKMPLDIYNITQTNALNNGKSLEEN